ncbi:MAG: hypothetical protein Q9226_008758, partial [Calogaya cf. arnoldii]
ALNPPSQQYANVASKDLTARLEVPQQMCKRGALCGGGGGDFGDGGGDFGGGGGDFGGGDFGGGTGDFGSNGGATGQAGGSDPIDIPTIEITGHRDDSPSLPPTMGGGGGIDPQLMAMNEEKGSGGLSVPCAFKSAIAGWEAGLACSLLEEKYGKPSAPPPAPAPPKSPAPPPKAPAPAHAPPLPPPPPPVPKAPAPAPAPKKSNNGGPRGTGRPGMIPRWIHHLYRA